MNGQWMANAGREDKYQYSGKELHDDFGLNWYEYGARFYDPAIARFTGVDPIADQFAWVSPYNYAENEPIANIDLHGLQALSFQVARDAANNPNGVGAHVAGVSKGLMGTIQGTVDAVLNPVSTAKGIWNALTNPEETAASIREGVSEVANNLVSGDGVERGEALYEVGTVVIAELKAGKLSKLGKLDTPGSVISETVGAVDKPNPLKPGTYANESIPSKKGKSRNFSKEVRDKINKIGYETGCHTCGTKTPGTKSGNFIPDHQPANALVPDGTPQKLFPHCKNCSSSQGGTISAIKRKQKKD